MGEFGECGGDSPDWRNVNGEFVVAAAKVLNAGMSGNDHLRCYV
jgi:hypothetical protein